MKPDQVRAARDNLQPAYQSVKAMSGSGLQEPPARCPGSPWPGCAQSRHRSALMSSMHTSQLTPPHLLKPLHFAEEKTGIPRHRIT